MFQGSLWVLTESFEEVFQRSFREISRVLQESSKGIKVRLKGILSSCKRVSRVSKRSSTGVKGKIQRWFTKVSKNCQGSFKSGSKEFQGYLKKVSIAFLKKI